ncbi:MAG: XrtA-associated tyrosine autokinase [Burkholderiaceae bacterium]|nr:XrtA-associated tyrosine autokinase [Burkholderiaceae bacterium]
MSLIERAVARLNEDRPEATPQSGPQAGSASPATQRTSIEALADRLGEPADVAVAPPPERPIAAPPPAPPLPEREPVRIHLEGLRARGMVVPNGPASQSAHEFRVIKRPLLGNAFGRHGQKPVRNGKRIMVTSAFPGEGKSFTSVNLAMSIAAERDHGVLLIDADVARPTIPRELGIHADVGLMDWLIDGGPPLSQLVLPTNVETLSLLPAGRHNEHATEWLASEAMGRLLDELTRLYPDCVLIFDSPPLLVTTEARVLASYMGQIVMVVESGRTPREAVTQALSTIESNEVVGLVLNKAHNIESNGYYQGYGYGYGYGATGSS